ncbi:hypothetical protein RB195_020444 [Necator americanus]
MLSSVIVLLLVTAISITVLPTSAQYDATQHRVKRQWGYGGFGGMGGYGGMGWGGMGRPPPPPPPMGGMYGGGMYGGGMWGK